MDYQLTHPEIVIATRGIKGHVLKVAMAIAFDLEATLFEHRVVVRPRGVWQVDCFGLRVELVLGRNKKFVNIL